jgi:SAM-dependent methyltransferase
MNCRNCTNPLHNIFIDLGHAPPSNSYIEPTSIGIQETTFPLQVYVCEQCWLVQTSDYVHSEELFNASYAYFSSVSVGWLKHASKYVEMIIKRQGLDKNSMVIEIASNDGYLLKNFVSAKVPCLGIEPTRDTAQAARSLNIPVLSEFFTSKLANKLADSNKYADLIIGNNVLAHVPDILDFVKGLKRILKPNGIVTMEFPHLLQLIKNNQFDTVYHEHFSYLSLGVVKQIFEQHALNIVDVEELSTHGGSLRIYAKHTELTSFINVNVAKLLCAEKSFGLQELLTYLDFQQSAEQVKSTLLDFLNEQKRLGKRVIGYGAAAKGNTLLNFAGVTTELLPIICDAAPSKQGKLMPGSHIPIHSPTYLEKNIADFVLILPWNIKNEVIKQLSFMKNTRFVTVIPKLELR